MTINTRHARKLAERLRVLADGYGHAGQLREANDLTEAADFVDSADVTIEKRAVLETRVRHHGQRIVAMDRENARLRAALRRAELLAEEWIKTGAAPPDAALETAARERRTCGRELRTVLADPKSSEAS